MSERDPQAVRSMFDRIAPRYDRVNTLLSAGLDSWWRRRATEASELNPGGRALDIACGSGVLTRRLAVRAGPEGLVVGLDFSRRMLAVAVKADRGCTFVQGDALALPFRDAEFDAVTIAYGLRNLSDPGRGLGEMRRVLRPGGVAVVLEFLRPPRGVVGSIYRAYLKRILPLVGGRLGRDPGAYRYLSDTVDAYRTLLELQQLAAAAGWTEVRGHSLTFGTVGLVVGQKSAQDR